MEWNIKRMQYNTSPLSLASLPTDTAALPQFLVNEPANFGMRTPFEYFDHLSDVDSGGFSSFHLQVLTDFSTRNILNDMKAVHVKHSKIIYMLLAYICVLWHMYLP